jgi:hypothetical protein
MLRLKLLGFGSLISSYRVTKLSLWASASRLRERLPRTEELRMPIGSRRRPTLAVSKAGFAPDAFDPAPAPRLEAIIRRSFNAVDAFTPRP